MRRKLVIIFITILCLIIFNGCNSEKEKNIETNEETFLIKNNDVA